MSGVGQLDIPPARIATLSLVRGGIAGSDMERLAISHI